MILLGLGANLASAAGVPEKTLHAACEEFSAHNVKLVSLSPFYRTAPMPVSEQPWFVNAAAIVASSFSPHELLQIMQRIEKKFGRARAHEAKNAPRTLDLDLLDHNGKIFSDNSLTLPHPAMHARAFVLYPLRDVAADWRHPVTDKSVSELIADLASVQQIERMPSSA